MISKRLFWVIINSILIKIYLIMIYCYNVSCLKRRVDKMTTKNPTRIYHFILIIGILFIAFNLRPGITAVGPLIGTIRDDLGLANWSAGLLTSLPLVAFAIISPIVLRFISVERRVGKVC